jgi:hypothetical protein
MGSRSAIAKRDSFERELVQIITEKTGFFGQRGTHTDGVDVMFFKAMENSDIWTQAIRCEIKTTVETKRWFTRDQKMMKQYFTYREILEKYGIMTFYFFRTLDRHKSIELKNRKKEVIKAIEFRDGHIEDKWRVFKVNDLPMTKDFSPYLDFFDEKAMTIDEFINLISEV